MTTNLEPILRVALVSSDAHTGLTWEDCKALAEIFALVCAGGFFIYKFCQGYFFVNLSLGISAERKQSAKSGYDHLIVRAKLEKGERGSIQIHDAQARIRFVPGSSAHDIAPVALNGFERLSNRPENVGDFERKTVNWSKRSETSPFLRLTPGEKTEFSCLFEIPRNEPCSVEVVILGNEQSWLSKYKKWKSGGRKIGLGQWRASVISLPVS